MLSLTDLTQPVKLCKKCNTEKPLVDFYRNRRSKDGLHYYCKTCNNPLIGGLTTAQYNDMLGGQGGRCANTGCDNTPPPNKRFAVDHDHNCCPRGKPSCGSCVRGLLCDGCNIALGLVEEDVYRLLGLVDYLRNARKLY